MDPDPNRYSAHNVGSGSETLVKVAADGGLATPLCLQLCCVLSPWLFGDQQWWHFHMWICSRQFWNHVQVGTVVCRVAGSGFKLKMRFFQPTTTIKYCLAWLRKTIFWVKYLNSLMRIRIRDPEMEKFGSGIWDKHPGSVTLLKCKKYFIL